MKDSPLISQPLHLAAAITRGFVGRVGRVGIVRMDKRIRSVLDGVSVGHWVSTLRASCRRAPPAQDVNGRLKVYLDCNDCFGDYIREEVDMVEYVRDPAEADVHIIVSRADTASGGVEQAVALIGLGRFKGMNFNLRAISQSGDTEDTQRQRLATAITIGLLNYLCEYRCQGRD